MLIFEEEEKRRTRRKLRARARTNNKLNPHMTHWWTVYALTTAPPLLPSKVLMTFIIIQSTHLATKDTPPVSREDGTSSLYKNSGVLS